MADLLDRHLRLLSMDKTSKAERYTASREHETRTAPLFSYRAVTALEEWYSSTDVYPQHCLLAGILSQGESTTAAEPSPPTTPSSSDSSGTDNKGKTSYPPPFGGYNNNGVALYSGPSSGTGRGDRGRFHLGRGRGRGRGSDLGRGGGYQGHNDAKDRNDAQGIPEEDPRIFLNVNAPWSAFICGSQGSGKSHTMSCMLESCLVASTELGNLLPHPLAGLVFHYDKHSGTAGTVSEAAYLCSAGIAVTVLVSESSLGKMERIYGGMNLPDGVQRPKVKVLKFQDRHLNLERLMSLMCVSTEEKKPLYIETITKILREMAIESSHSSSSDDGVDYDEFVARIDAADLKPDQRNPLNLRLHILESFLEKKRGLRRTKMKKVVPISSDPWITKPGTLTIVDLSSPFIDESSACNLFSMCLSLFLENDSSNTPPQIGSTAQTNSSSVGKVVALDEAHKFMTSTPGSETFTASLISCIRMQRHYGLRVIIATQEPTISPALMDLCSLTIVHRFSSPSWMTALKGHLPGVNMKQHGGDNHEDEVFKTIVELGTGEALLFCPSALLTVLGKGRVEKMGVGRRKVRIRKRVTNDGGASVMAA